ncbi:MAG: hypothetical protein MUC97_07715 [Bernardetiaceae bacterium]|jgi:hypothetical protein|nr:hypothetical protein [Bernardetiaceae bacterium]
MKKQILVGLLIATAVVACQKSEDPAPVCEENLEVPVGPRLTLNDREWIEVRNLQDSRCPQGMMCLWPGEVRLEVWLGENGREHRLPLCLGMCGGAAGRPTPTKTADTAWVVVDRADYRVILREVKPYPGSGEAGPTRAVLQLNRCLPNAQPQK